MARRKVRGMTLKEMLVVIAIISILTAFLLPAVHVARESSRRVKCQNNLRQIGLAMHGYNDAYGSLPSGIVKTNRTMWSGLILPQIEQHNLFDAIDSSQPWLDGTPNAIPPATWLPLFRCPSTDAPKHINAQGISGRVPNSYLACSSGTAMTESGPAPRLGVPDSDGIFFQDSAISLTRIRDGLSHTIAAGEALFYFENRGPDYFGIGQFVDHWYIGTPEGMYNEYSEGLASTGVPINSVFIKSNPSEWQEMCYSSYHRSGVQLVFADGHVTYLTEDVDWHHWKSLGTRDRGIR